ncbi:hypothetical protein BESB_007510 [Besnoitia besnoiti]|uniref:C3H1-type domain-containing protein n=1 Tax=Besnoitia besnoiti TaxID=94643 RepID=A0A2A9MKF2_BESBE|nr:hypothetical protein BESB_007510 [Besnoitia besnoiti]PFH38409.1 hypothetical protein BESB_007510 [Besnoitia besnoiti]
MPRSRKSNKSAGAAAAVAAAGLTGWVAACKGVKHKRQYVRNHAGERPVSSRASNHASPPVPHGQDEFPPLPRSSVSCNSPENPSKVTTASVNTAPTGDPQVLRTRCGPTRINISGDPVQQVLLKANKPLDAAPAAAPERAYRLNVDDNSTKAADFRSSNVASSPHHSPPRTLKSFTRSIKKNDEGDSQAPGDFQRSQIHLRKMRHGSIQTRSKPCQMFASGYCRYGANCRYLHAEQEPSWLDSIALMAGFRTACVFDCLHVFEAKSSRSSVKGTSASRRNGKAAMNTDTGPRISEDPTPLGAQ